jgi:hypothetical protein
MIYLYNEGFLCGTVSKVTPFGPQQAVFAGNELLECGQLPILDCGHLLKFTLFFSFSQS